MTFEISNQFLTAQITEIGAELISVTGKDGYEYIWGADPSYWGSHAPLLFPICGRILNGKYSSGGKDYEMSAHGFAKNMRFRVKEHFSDSLTLALRSNDETLEQYPFEFELLANFTLKDDTLSIFYTVTNHGAEEMPYMIGWHPGFNLWGDNEICDFSLSFKEKTALTKFPLQNGCFVCPRGVNYPLDDGKYALCEEEIYSNDTLIFTGTKESVTLSRVGSRRRIKMSWSKNLPYLCIWKKNDSAARFICLEPWSDVPNTGDVEENFDVRRMSRLAPTASERYDYTVRFS